MKKLKAYMAFSQEAGPLEGAVLVLHYTAKEARKFVYSAIQGDITEDYLDTAVRWLREPWAVKMGHPDLPNTPHVIWSPPSCQYCGFWGSGITKNELCGNCDRPPGPEVMALFN